MKDALVSAEQRPIISARLLATADRAVWPSGALITGVLDVTNAASDRLVFGTGSPAVGMLSTLDGTAVGNNSRPHRGVGRRVDLAPGDTTTIRFVCFSSNVNPARGTTLPPGEYLLTVRLHASRDRAEDELAAPPVAIRLE